LLTISELSVIHDQLCFVGSKIGLGFNWAIIVKRNCGEMDERGDAAAGMRALVVNAEEGGGQGLEGRMEEEGVGRDENSEVGDGVAVVALQGPQEMDEGLRSILNNSLVRT
jgi:hypothetical protein